MPTFKRADQEQMEKAKDLIDAQSSTEMGYVKSLFFGRLKPQDVLPYPTQSAEEIARTDELIAKLDVFLKEKVDADKIDTEEKIDPEIIRGLGELGVLGMTVPKEYGGGGFAHTSYCRVLEHVAKHDTSTAVLIGAHQSIGLKALMLSGTDEQKKQFLPDLASGKKLAAFCLSEPDVGSDAANVQTTALLSDDKSHWVLNGNKRYATNAALAGFMTVMAKTRVGDKDKVTAFIVTPDLPGFEVVSPNRSKMGIRGSWQATLKFTDMRVPADRVLGQVGKGLRVALSVLDFGRCTLSAGCVGGAKKALSMAVDHAKTRKQFDRTIGDFHLVKQKLASMAETTFAMDALTYMCSGMVDRHAEDMVLETAICKLFCSEGAWKVIDDAVQIWGGEGYMREHGLERMLRDARINRIVEGTTEVMTAFVALLGMKGVGEDLESVLHLTKHPIGNFGRLAQFTKTQISDVIVGHGFDGLGRELSAEGHMISRTTRVLARDIIRLLATYREKILDYQLIQQRVAWSVIELYAMTAVVAKLQGMIDAGSPDLKKAMTIGKGYCKHAAERINAHLGSLFRNTDADTIRVADAVLE